jgi:putative endonuclease
MFLYILFSEKSNIYYVGITHNLSKRLNEHNFTSVNSFTSKHRPWVLSAAYKCKNITMASWSEAYIKQQKSSKFIEKHLLDENSQHPLLKNMERVYL